MGVREDAAAARVKAVEGQGRAGVGKEVPAEAGVAAGEASVRATKRPLKQAHAMCHAAVLARVHDPLIVHAVAVYPRIVWKRTPRLKVLLYNIRGM